MNTESSTSDRGPEYRLAHISDIHFGRIAHPAIVESLVSEINDSQVDLVVASGDLTQRAFPHQYRAAAQMLASFDAPSITIPGNHDVFPWWRTLSRLFDPLRRYRRMITDDLSPQFTKDGLAVLGINSAFGRTIKGGRIDDSQRLAMRAFFGSLPDSTFRVLTVHHHLTALEALGDHDIAVEAEATLTCAAEMNVDLVLCGHLHVSHVAHVQVLPGGHPLVIASAGTATSSRGRKPHKRTNFYNQIVVRERQFEIVEHQFNPENLIFEKARTTAFDRVRSR
ncbi:MAG: metallophosphoesterase family protein [Rhodothermia bacterium]|nr:MAG: metallophosphoesterase family protein [Rhodothermia bacterium]